MTINWKAAGAAVAMFVMAVGAFADAVVLKSGEKLTGKILRETPEELTILVSVTPSINDDKVIKKADITVIERTPPAEEAWLPLTNLSLGEESMEAEEYNTVLTSLSGFIKKFPESDHVAEAKVKIERFQNELKRVESGQLKLDGQWLERTKVIEERIQIGGRILLNRMKRLASAGQGIEAMQVFEAIEKNYGGSASFPDAVLVARKILPTLVAAVENRKAELKRRAERDKMRLQIAKGAEREKLEAIFKQERESMSAIAQAHLTSGTKWMPLVYATDANIAGMGTTISAEMARVYAIPLDKMRISLIGAQTAATALASRDLVSAEKSLAEAKSAWAANELMLRLSDQLSDAKKAEALAKAALQAASKATPTPRPKRTP